MYQVSPPCLCCAIKLINKGEHPCIKKAKEENKKKPNQRKPNYLVRDSSEVPYVSCLYKWSVGRELSGSTPEVAAFQ